MRAFPAWLGSDGFPLSWAHYVVGTMYLQRARARQMIDTYDAVRMAWVGGDDGDRWRRLMSIDAGW